MLPMIAAMATKLLGGKMDIMSGANNPGVKENYFNEILGFLDANKDGSISDDLGRIGKQIMGNLFTEENKKEV